MALEYHRVWVRNDALFMLQKRLLWVPAQDEQRAELVSRSRTTKGDLKKKKLLTHTTHGE